MRILPDHPNLDFMRQEAKHLLAALRESEPATALSDAQRIVAEQYGFRGWPDLKAEVDRRRSEAPAADPSFALELAKAFGLGTVVGEAVPVSWNHMGRRWRIRTDRGEWLAGPVFDYIGAEAAEIAHDLRERARAAGVVAPTAVRSPDSSLIERVQGQSWRVDEWLDVGPEVLQPVRSSVLQSVGRTIATLHDRRRTARSPRG